MSGRRSKSVEGNPGGIAAGCSCCVDDQEVSRPSRLCKEKNGGSTTFAGLAIDFSGLGRVGVLA